MANNIMAGEMLVTGYDFWLFSGPRRSTRPASELDDPGGFADFQAAFKLVGDATAWYEEATLPGGTLRRGQCWAHVVHVAPGSRLRKVAWINAITDAWHIVPGVT